ncbi:MAG: MiaB/RimO family radical SAM methylthiotransferase, partial [Anaerolineales bacterium]
QLTAAGHLLVATMEEADLMVLNTCTVTAAAASDSRQKIRQANKAGISEVVVTGCLSTIKPEKISKMPGVIQVVPNKDKENLVADLLQIPLSELESDAILRQPVPGARLRTRAFIKVQDGCDNKCTFCITTVARGAGRSRPIAAVLRDVQAALDSGVKEVVLTGVHLGSWGYDFPAPQHLKDLVTTLLSETDLPRLRLSSLEPWDLDEDFFTLWQDPRLCRHLHLPLQSGSGGVLRRMARKIIPDKFAALVDAARSQIPGVAITTDLIAGFPGETGQEFEEGLRFVESMEFAGAHVFTYSARRGTAAARMPDQVHNYTRKERSAALREAAAKSEQRYYQDFLGEQLDVLWETAHFDSAAKRWQLIGLTDNYLRIQAEADRSLWNEITPCQMIALNETPAYISGKITQYPDTI